MSYEFHADPNVDEDTIPEYPKIPAGERFLKVINWNDSGFSKNGYPCIQLEIQDTQTSIKMKHWLYLLPKGNPGHGITKKFLKTLEGNKVEGDISVDPDKWLGKIFKAEVIYEPSKKDPNKEFATLVIHTLKTLDETDNPNSYTEGLEPIPF